MNKQLVIGAVIGGLAITAIAAVASYKSMDSRSASVGRQECHDELVTLTRPTKDPDQITGTVTGAVVGGVLGNQVGSGDGKKVATAVGAIGGGIAGHEIQEGVQERNTYQELKQVCKTINDTH